MHAGTYGPSKGNGYLYAPLKGNKASIIRSILNGAAANPQVNQSQVQSLLWAVETKSKINKLSPQLQRVASILLSEKEIYDLNGGALGLIPESLKEMAISQIPPELRGIYEIQAELRNKLTQVHSNFAELERIAVLTGNPPKSGIEVPDQSWSAHPGGFFVRYIPHGYSSTTIQVFVPQKELSSSQNNETMLKKVSLTISQNKLNDARKSDKSATVKISAGTQAVEYDPTDDVAVPGNTHSQRIGFQSIPDQTLSDSKLPKKEKTCEEFNKEALTYGMASPAGTSLPGRIGYTHRIIKFTSEWKGQITSKTKVGAQSYKFCMKVNTILPNYSYTLDQKVLKWSPSTPVSPACSKEIKEWTDLVMEHEQIHGEDTIIRINKANAEWRSTAYQPEACAIGATQAESGVKAILEEKVNSYLLEELNKLNNILKEDDDFADKITSPLRPLNCDICGSQQSQPNS